MLIEISTKNYKVKEYLRELIMKKVEKLDRYFNDTATAKVYCKLENDVSKMEVTVIDKAMIFKSEHSGDNMYENLDIVLPKIERQIIKTFEKNKDKLKKLDKVPTEFVYMDKAPVLSKSKVIKHKKLELMPLTEEEAHTNFEMIDNTFYIYLNRTNNKVNVMYRRHDGNVGVIETIY